jgi:hypothetical protein
MQSFYRFGFSQPFSLGQGDSQTLNMIESKKLFDDLDRANDKYGVVTDWKKKHPDLQKDLGSDYENWQLVSEDDTKYGSAAQAFRDRLEKEVMVDLNPQVSVSPDETMAANIWIPAVDRLYVISANHTGRPSASKTTPEANGSPSGASAGGHGSALPVVLAVSGAAFLAFVVFGGLSK